MRKKDLAAVIGEKKVQGKDRIVISVSFKFTDDFELGLLEHLWQYKHSHHLKRLLQRDKEGIMPASSYPVHVEEEIEEEDISSFI